ncbi:hypothetical protein CI102_1016 [Trichoderma harzianum]|nr:hypothetical protein CI102_1016 [Trichoderma harzianum]
MQQKCRRDWLSRFASPLVHAYATVARTYRSTAMPVNTHPQLWRWSNKSLHALQRAAKSRHLTSPKKHQLPTSSSSTKRKTPLALRSPHCIPAFPFLSSHLSLNARHIHVLKRSAPLSATRLAYGTLRRSNIVTPRLCSPSRLIIILLIQVHVCDNACQRNSMPSSVISRA